MNAYLGKYTYVFLSILELPAYLGSTYLASMNPPIASQNWDVLDNFQDPKDMWREWKVKFLNVNTHTPLRTKHHQCCFLRG